MIAKGLRIIENNPGVGSVIEAGDLVSYHYDCYYPQGELLHSSRENEPIQSCAGSRDLCVGISQGLIGMKEGGSRTIEVPPQLTHVERKIWRQLPENIVLRYEVEIIEIIQKPQ
jgi:FKBP-type peptidyl-prolyl cis-trans isomerase